jgi:hypothetical protein
MSAWKMTASMISVEENSEFNSQVVAVKLVKRETSTVLKKASSIKSSLVATSFFRSRAKW